MSRQNPAESITGRQRDMLDQWAVWLYRQGYTTRQAGAALDVASSTVSNALARSGVSSRRGLGTRPDLEPDLYAKRWRALEPVPGAALADGKLNQHGLLTVALATWKGKNALVLLASRALEATEAERKDAVALLDETIAYAEKLQLVLLSPHGDYADGVRTDPRHRDDVGHRFSGER